MAQPRLEIQRGFLILLIFLTCTTFVLFIMSCAMLSLYTKLGINHVSSFHSYNLIINLFMLIHCSFGWYGLMQESKTYWYLYHLVSYPLSGILLLFNLLIFYWLISGETHKSLELGFTQKFKQYVVLAMTKEEVKIKNNLDSAQRLLMCCGAHNSSEWLTNPNESSRTYPVNSCGNNERGCIGAAHILEILVRGCLFIEWLIWFGAFITRWCGYKYFSDLPEFTEDNLENTTTRILQQQDNNPSSIRSLKSNKRTGFVK